MKSVFDKTVREELIERVRSLNNNSTAQWGRMTVYQMIKHCTLWEEMIQGRQTYKRAFIGRIFGKMALRSVLKDEAPLRRNTPTLPQLKIEGDGDISEEKTKWISEIDNYANFTNTNFVHAFFGKMTKDQIGCFVYKHSDHHLRQFGA